MQKEKLVPAIRFKGFGEDWNNKLVKSLGYITTGNSNTKDSVLNGAYPFFIRSDKPLRSNKYLYDEEAVITIGDGNIGKVFHYINGKFDLHQRCYKISNFTDILGKYFYWYFSSNFYDRVIRMSAKATVDSVRLEMIADMEIYFPYNKKEQSKISTFLDSLDSLIHSQELKLEKLQTIKQSLLNNMFASFERKMPKIRFKAFVENFEVIRLNEIAEYKNGKGHEKFVLEKGKYILVNSKFISSNASQCKYTNINISPLFKNDIVMVLSDIPGGKALAKTFLIDNDNKYALNQRICALTSKSTSPIYLSIILNRNSQLLALDDHVNQTNINRQQVMDLLLLIPSYAEQQKIGQFFSNLDSLIHSQEQKLEKLNNIKQALLEKMFC
ncbi:restriction endonuclease subunit S [Mycoplasma sp. VS42A]|uniref:restriction endonuclease subunit S n=1 Tax=Mycoplasma sp. VS42A TaxID=3398774 RepID=UPI003A8BCEA7